MDISIFPTVNATLNALAGVLLFCGFRAIKRKNSNLHKKYMVSAFVCSAVFLICYLTYHYLKKGIVTRYEGEGILKAIYLLVLITHSFLAAIVAPAAIAAVWVAFKGNFKAHVNITKWLYPIWMYVSVTGVIVYLMLYVF